MMKHRLAEHTLFHLSKKITEDMFKNSFHIWHRCAIDERIFSIRSQRALDRLCLRVERRVVHSWQDTCVWSRILENLAKVAISRCYTKYQKIVMDSWSDKLQRSKRLRVKAKHSDSHCLRNLFRRWVMCARISRVRYIQLCRLLERKDNRLIRQSFAAYVAVHRAVKSLYNIDRLVRKTAILSGAVTLRAWRETIECNNHMEKVGNMVARRWNFVDNRRTFQEWVSVWKLNQIASHAGFSIADKSRRGVLRTALAAWGHAMHQETILQCAGMRIANKGGYQLKAKSFALWAESRMRSRRLALCFDVISGKHQVQHRMTQAFDGWMMVLDVSRRLKAVDRKAQWHDWQLSGQVVLAWRRAARRSRKFSIFGKLTDGKLKRIWIKNCFYHWKDRSLDYFRSWRKSEMLKARFGLSLVSLHMATWKEKTHSKTRILRFFAKLNTRVLGNSLQEWFALSQKEIARAGRTEQGISRIASNRAYKMQVECIDMWHAKFSCRKRVGEITDTKKQNVGRALKDKYLANMMRQLDDIVFRRTQVFKCDRNRCIRMMTKSFRALVHHREVQRIYAHRTRHIQICHNINMCSNVYRHWFDEWAVSQVKGKLYYGLIARGDRKVISCAYNKWCRWVKFRKQQKQKVAKALWLNVPRYQAMRVMSTWADKHNRTMHFEKLVLSRNRTSCQGALDAWYDYVKDKLLQSNCIAKLWLRVRSKIVSSWLKTWHEHTVWYSYSDLVVRRAHTSTSMMQLQKVLSNWSQNVIAIRKRRAKGSIFQLRMKSTARACIFSAWSDYYHDGKRRYQDLSTKFRRALASAQRVHFEGWKAVCSVLKFRDSKLKKVCLRLFLSSVRESFMKWYQVTFDTSLLVGKSKYLHLLTQQHLIRKCYKVLRMNVGSCKAARKAVLRRWQKSLLVAGLEVLFQWRNQFYFERKAKKVLMTAFDRMDNVAKLKCFGVWRRRLRKSRRLNQHAFVWGWRQEKTVFDGWLALVLQGRSCSIRALLKNGRSDCKLCNQVFLFWEYLSSTLRSRRIKVIKMLGRRETNLLRCFFTALMDGIAIVRRRRLLLAKTMIAVDKIHICHATAHLMENSKKARRRRRIFEMLVCRNHTKLVQHAWGEWEMRMEVLPPRPCLSKYYTGSHYRCCHDALHTRMRCVSVCLLWLTCSLKSMHFLATPYTPLL
jgi:hypothetical protein